MKDAAEVEFHVAEFLDENLILKKGLHSTLQILTKQFTISINVGKMDRVEQQAYLRSHRISILINNDYLERMCQFQHIRS